MVCISKICLFLINFLKNMIEVRLGTNWYVLRIILLELSRQNFLSPVTVPPKITVRELHCGLLSRQWGIDQNRPYSAEGKLILFDKLHKIVWCNFDVFKCNHSFMCFINCNISCNLACWPQMWNKIWNEMKWNKMKWNLVLAKIKNVIFLTAHTTFKLAKTRRLFFFKKL